MICDGCGQKLKIRYSKQKRLPDGQVHEFKTSYADCNKCDTRFLLKIYPELTFEVKCKLD